MKTLKRSIGMYGISALLVLAAAAATPRGARAQQEEQAVPDSGYPPPGGYDTTTPPDDTGTGENPAPASEAPPPVYYSTYTAPAPPPAASEVVYVASPPEKSELPGPKSGFSLGGRGMWFRPADANSGSWSGGAQARMHFFPWLAVEGSVDYRQANFGGVVTDVYPVQVSGLIYLLPHFPISPYVLGGVGWYYSHFREPFNDSQHRFGPHAGGGVEFFMNDHWSLDSGFRYVWSEKLRSDSAGNPNGTAFRDRGKMVTIGLNYWF